LFLANVSHELRTPLNAIIGFSELIKDQRFGPGASEQYRDYAKDIHESGIHLLSLINDLLDLSKIEAGKFELHDEQVDVGDIIGASLRLLGERAGAASVELDVEAPHDLPSLRADERVVKQILINLLSNAIKFTPAGGRVSIAAGAEPDGTLALCISDTGIGIGEEQLQKAMSPFEQVDSSLPRKYDGTGLGLPLTKGMVELHGGSLQIDSALGRGTTVRVSFPKERVLTGSAAA
jgi:signal transduction histidine kinase